MLVLLIRGLLSVFLSRALEDLGARLTAAGIKNTVTDHGNAFCWFCNVNAIIEQCKEAHAKGEKIILIGHSFGATSILMITRALYRLGIIVDFAGPIDPAVQYDTSITNNVHTGLSYYQQTPGQLGQGIVHPDDTWVPEREFADRMTVKRLNDTHLGIIAEPYVQNALFNGVSKCVRS